MNRCALSRMGWHRSPEPHSEWLDLPPAMLRVPLPRGLSEGVSIGQARTKVFCVDDHNYEMSAALLAPSFRWDNQDSGINE